jgi:hypothetical protein
MAKVMVSRSHLPEISAGFGTFPIMIRGCRGFIEPYSPPLWIRDYLYVVVNVLAKTIARLRIERKQIGD